ncbi:hypothetical protein T06_12515 [Trichinella sp. T6]|nr:hypothetical protein T06_8689 [Trichinella sp. T6]KRX70030.1 hypothetical protein T06_12515 [Trichinella sp. T6]
MIIEYFFILRGHFDLRLASFTLFYAKFPPKGTIARRLHNVTPQHFDQEGFHLRSLVVGDPPWLAPHWLGVSGVNDVALHARPPEVQI